MKRERLSHVIMAQKMTRQTLNKDRVMKACNNETLSKKTQDKL